MRVLQNGIYALLALSTALSGVIGIPIDGQGSRDTSIAANNQRRQAKPAGNNTLIAPDELLAQLESRDVKTFDLEKRQNPPTVQDFLNFLNDPARVGLSGLFVFWSGVGQQGSTDFATAQGRSTLGMLLGNQWIEYQTPNGDGAGNHWPSWAATITGFWDPASEACARWATGVVMVYMTREYMDDQTRPNCPTCWYRVEKPRLITRIGNGVTRIDKYTSPWRNGKGPAGVITAMDNKV